MFILFEIAHTSATVATTAVKIIPLHSYVKSSVLFYFAFNKYDGDVQMTHPCLLGEAFEIMILKALGGGIGRSCAQALGLDGSQFLVDVYRCPMWHQSRLLSFHVIYFLSNPFLLIRTV